MSRNELSMEGKIHSAKRFGSRSKLSGSSSSKKKLLDSLFPKWELQLYPKTLQRAIAKVERHDFIKKELHKLEHSNANMENSESSSLRQKPQSKQRSLKLGVERLPISELEEIADNLVISLVNISTVSHR
jgi:hypothetical protein